MNQLIKTGSFNYAMGEAKGWSMSYWKKSRNRDWLPPIWIYPHVPTTAHKITCFGQEIVRICCQKTTHRYLRFFGVGLKKSYLAIVMIPSIKLMPKKWAQHQGPPRPPTETEKTTMADEKRKLDHRVFLGWWICWNLVTDHFGSGQTGKALFVCFVNTMKIKQSFWAAIHLRLLGQLTRFVFKDAVKNM